jgi:hypothetical protein
MPKQQPAPSTVLALRLPPDLAATIRAQAEAENRSINGHLVYLLRWAISHYQPPQ